MNRHATIQQLLRDMHALHRTSGVKSLGSAAMHTITPAQWGVLFLLEEPEIHTIKTVAKALQVTSSAATQMVDVLVRAGYVVRTNDTRDRRSVLLSLSRKAKTTLGRMRTHIEAHTAKVFSAFTDAELREYGMLTSKLVSTKEPTLHL